MVKTLIAPAELMQNLDHENWVIVDCRYSLADTESGRRLYGEAHIPGAVYAHLDEDLCGQPLTDHGRHPLPSAAVMAERFCLMGIDADTELLLIVTEEYDEDTANEVKLIVPFFELTVNRISVSVR